MGRGIGRGSSLPMLKLEVAGSVELGSAKLSLGQPTTNKTPTTTHSDLGPSWLRINSHNNRNNSPTLPASSTASTPI